MRKKRRAKKGKAEPEATRPKNLAEVKARIQHGKTYLTTREIKRVFGVHQITVYKWVMAGKLLKYRSGAKGKANLYLVKDVLEFARRRFEPHVVEG